MPFPCMLNRKTTRIIDVKSSNGVTLEDYKLIGRVKNEPERKDNNF